jgi:hypothetical protein
MSTRHLFAAAPLLAALLLASAGAHADPSTTKRFVIERDIPGAAQMTPVQLRDAAIKSNRVLHDLGPDIQWVQTTSPATRSTASTPRRARR